MRRHPYESAVEAGFSKMSTLDLTWLVLKSRWFVLAAGLWIEGIAGSAYTFGIYSQSLKLALGYDQKHLDSLAFSKTIGGNAGVLSGLLYNVVPPWILILIGAVECSSGYFMLWLSVTARISPSFWQVCVFIGLAVNSNTFFSTAIVVTNVQNFPKKRGLVIGILKGFLGLSGAIMTPIFYAVYPNDPSSFLFLISWLPAAVSVLLMAFIRVLPASEEDNSTFKKFTTVAICLAAYLTVVVIIEKVWSDQIWLFRIFCLLLLGFLLSFFVIAIGAELKEGCADSGKNCVSDENVITEALIRRQDSEQIEEDENESDGVDEGGKDPCRGAEQTLIEAVSSLDYWLLAMIMFCSMGSGTTAIDNMGQIGASLGYKQVEVNTFVSLISIWNFGGRFGAGLVSDLLLHRHGTTRPLCLAFSLGLMCFGNLVMASAAPGSLYVGSIVIGVCYGAQWSLMPATISELFGLRHFGTLYNSVTMANPAAAYILSVGVAGFFYDKEAQKQHDPSTLTMSTGSEDPLLCQGPSCFRITFIILAILCACGCVICVWLFSRTKRFYAQIHESLQMVD